MIEVKRLVKRFGLKTILKGVDFNVQPGEFVALLGPNGAGKTTFLRILASLSRPSLGSVKVAGYSLPNESANVRARLGVVSHLPLLYPDLTAEENLQFYARMYGISDHQFRISEVLQMVGLEPRRRDLVRTFSRGMQQRLAIGRAMLHDPSILFLDEPYTGLDQHAATMLTHWIKRVRGERRTILLVTHDLGQGLAMADRAMIFLHGKVAWQGAAAPLEEKQFSALYFDLVAKGER